MTINKPVQSSVSQTLIALLSNSLTFEVASRSELYTNQDIPLAETSDHLLRLYTSPILDSLDEILDSSKLVTFSTERDAKSFFLRPKILSDNHYGVTDYWWLIMAVNGYESVYDFKDFNYLWIPDAEVVKKIVMKKEFKEKSA